MKFKKLIICVTICLCTNCGVKEDTEFSQMGLSFTIPKGWYIIEDDNTSSESYLIGIGDKHRISDGVFYAIWFTFEKDINELLELAKESYENNMLKPIFKIKYSESKSIEFKGNDAVKVDITIDGIQIKFIGEIICFNWNGYSIMLVFIENTKKHNKIKPDFEKIKNSLKRIRNGKKEKKGSYKV